MPQRNSASSKDQLVCTFTPRRSVRLLANNHGKPDDPETPDPRPRISLIHQLFDEMPQRNSAISKERLVCTFTPRRSQRLLANNQGKPDVPETPDPKSRTARVHHSATPLTVPEKGSPKKSLQSKKVGGRASGSELNEKLSTGSRRSAATLSANVGLRRSSRFSGKDEVCVQPKSLNQSLDRAELGTDVCKLDVAKRPISRKKLTGNSSGSNANKSVKNSSGHGFNDIESPCFEVSGEGVIAKRGNLGVSSSKKSQRKPGKRATGNSSGSNANKSAKNSCGDGFDEIDNSCCEVSDEEGVIPRRESLGVSSSKKSQSKSGKRETGKRGSNASKCVKYTRLDRINETGTSCIELSDELVLAKTEKLVVPSSKKLNLKLGKRVKCSSAASSMAVRIEKEKTTDTDKGTGVLGVKRKRNQIEGSPRIVQGWTKDQELALQRAYFAAKPTPHFWKKVSKLVPGKTAQDCFDKINSDHLTPPQPRTRSKTRTTSSPSSLSTSSPLSRLSASRFLKSSEPKAKRPNHKLKSCLAQKTVRQILEKHYNVDQHYEADLFSVLESTYDPSASTPECGKPEYTRKFSSSAGKKTRSRLGTLHEAAAPLVSPPVLKQVKNKALHEKYIDKLHTREAKRRKEASAHASVAFPVTSDAVKAAKNALVLDANDVINQLKHLKDSATSKCSDFDDDDEEMEWDEDEEGAED